MNNTIMMNSSGGNNRFSSLPGSNYDDEELFRAERKMLFSRLPILAASSAELKKSGEYVVSEVGPESVIIARNEEGGISAVANTCRHRGTRLIERKPTGECNSGRLTCYTCPYHAWRYDLNGQLIAARGLEETDPGLRSLKLRNLTTQEIAGLVFYHGNPQPIPELEVLKERLERFELENTKVGAQKTYVVNGNWKLWVENFMECWHCAPNHPELRSVKSFINQFESGDIDSYMALDTSWRQRTASQGMLLPTDIEFEEVKSYFQFHIIMPFSEDTKSATKGGARVGPTLGNAEAMENGALFGCLGPCFFYMAYVDYVVLFSVLPQSTKETHVQLTWLVHPDFDGNIEDVQWLWDSTIQQDQFLVEETQRGVESAHYIPGQFTPDEYRTEAFTTWWMKWKQKHVGR